MNLVPRELHVNNRGDRTTLVSQVRSLESATAVYYNTYEADTGQTNFGFTCNEQTGDIYFSGGFLPSTGADNHEWVSSAFNFAFSILDDTDPNLHIVDFTVNFLAAVGGDYVGGNPIVGEESASTLYYFNANPEHAAWAKEHSQSNQAHSAQLRCSKGHLYE